MQSRNTRSMDERTQPTASMAESPPMTDSIPPSAPPARARFLRALLGVCLLLTVLDTAYFSQRYLRLRHGWVEPGTGICSFGARVDCDPVLLSPEARAFFVPNALLGLGFYLSVVTFAFAMRRRFPGAVRTRSLVLGGVLALASVVTLRFFQLLVRLPTLCPFCPWNHLLTYVACGAAFAHARRTSDSGDEPSREMLAGLGAASATPLVPIFAAWALFSGR